MRSRRSKTRRLFDLRPCQQPLYCLKWRISHSRSTTHREGISHDAKDSKLAEVGEKDAKHADLEQMFLRVLKKGLEEFIGPRAESSGKNTPPGPRRGRGYQASGRHGAKKSPEPKTEKAPSSQSNSAPPASTGADDPKEPRPPIKCYSCGLPGFIAQFCPNCLGNGKGARRRDRSRPTLNRRDSERRRGRSRVR